MVSQDQNQYDVIVIGAGPGGTAAATFLQRAGHRCLVLDRAEFPRYCIGESLIPHSWGTLDRLGLLDKLRQSDFVPKHSVRFVAPDGQGSQPFYFSETIDGDGARTWQVERGAFDRMCLDHAREQGVEIRQGVRVEEVLFDGDRAVGVRASKDGTTFELASRVVVDASGRATVLGTQLGLREPIPSLRKTSVWAYYRGGLRGEGIDAGETTILLLPHECWAWYIPLADDMVSVGVVGAREHIIQGGETPQEAFDRAVATHATLGGRLAQAERISEVRGGWGALAYYNKRTCGDGWVMVGDARAFLDPIYSSGVFLALASAEQAAGCIDTALRTGDLSAERLGAFEPELGAGVDVISRLIHAFYNPGFSFGEFLKRHPEQRKALIDCLVGDVFKDMGAFTDALEEMTPA